MKNSEIFFKAADEIVRRGLNQDGHYVPVDGYDHLDTCEVCVVGEVDVAAEAFAQFLADSGRSPHPPMVPEWNDDCEGTDEAVAVLREAAQAEAAVGR